MPSTPTDMAGTTSTAAPGVPSGVALLGMLQLTDSALPLSLIHI